MSETSNGTRYNLFEFPHKPFRFMWMELVSAIGHTNPGQEASLAALEEQVAFAVATYTHHNEDESVWFGPKLRELDPELADRWLAEHREHNHALTAFSNRVREIRKTVDLDSRRALLADYYRFATSFLQDDLEHMALEEGEIMYALQRKYDDAGLRELEAQFIAERVDPEYMQQVLPLFLRACNVDERTFLLQMARAKVPSPEAFEGLMNGLVASLVPEAELAELRARLAADA